MKGRVEDGHVRNVRERGTRLLDGCKRRTVVQRRQLGHGGELALDRVVDHDRLAEALAAVDDAVRDGPDPGRHGLQRLDRLGRVVLADHRQLQARRAGVDD